MHRMPQSSCSRTVPDVVDPNPYPAPNPSPTHDRLLPAAARGGAAAASRPSIARASRLRSGLRRVIGTHSRGHASFVTGSHPVKCHSCYATCVTAARSRLQEGQEMH